MEVTGSSAEDTFQFVEKLGTGSRAWIQDSNKTQLDCAPLVKSISVDATEVLV